MSDSIMKVRDLTKDFPVREEGRFFSRKSVFRAVDNVSFDVPAGGTLAIVGESGSGKSTTARMMARLLDISSGSVELEGKDITRVEGADLHKVRQTIQVVFQDPYSSLNPRHTVERIIMAPLDYQGVKPPKGRSTMVKELMERVGLDPNASQRYPRQFSGGQAQRIGIARALALKPKVVVCDEAVSALDVSVQARVINLLKELKQDLGLSYVFIAHDLAVVRQIADDVVVMQRGQVKEAGPRDQIFDAPQDAYTQKLIAAVPKIDPEWEERRQRYMQQHPLAAATDES
ncbi:ATP-binding cassette domain-containing protein [Galactobacter sp.]|uniref:ATP-binding cassette domain-containing protein n=1 Tax=Galactobacter sp. TaxID=2676125 RepID=UPI0025C17A5F|nr:ATP-binding cassette domain-containing protein [Galactobacter sp.]